MKKNRAFNVGGALHLACLAALIVPGDELQYNIFLSLCKSNIFLQKNK